MRRTWGTVLAALAVLTSCVGSSTHSATPRMTTVPPQSLASRPVEPSPAPSTSPTTQADQPVVIQPGIRVDDSSAVFSVLRSGDLEGNRLARLRPNGGMVEVADPLPRDASEAELTQLATRGSRWWAVSFNCTGGSLFGVAVARSTDAGNSWGAPVVLGGVSCNIPSGGRLTMLSDQRGIVDVWEQESTQHFVTSDGGAHWRLDAAFSPPFNASVPAYLPSGIAVATEAIFRAQLARSIDLGKHWRSISLGRGAHATRDPVAVGGRIVVQGRDKAHRERLYSSTDGVHWTTSAPLQCPCAGLRVSYVSERVWWTPRQRTVNGGRSWQQVAPLPGRDAGGASRWLTAVSSRFAVAVVYDTSSSARQSNMLYRTTDGGRTWQRVKPLPLS